MLDLSYEQYYELSDEKRALWHEAFPKNKQLANYKERRQTEKLLGIPSKKEKETMRKLEATRQQTVEIAKRIPISSKAIDPEAMEKFI